LGVGGGVRSLMVGQMTLDCDATGTACTIVVSGGALVLFWGGVVLANVYAKLASKHQARASRVCFLGRG